MKYKINKFDFLPSDALFIRETVFIKEQGFVDEIDEIDSFATHLVLYDENETPLATCRVFKTQENEDFILGRLCVLKEFRGIGLGKALMQETEKTVLALSGKALSLHSQYKAKEFYKKLGYSEQGTPDYEQGCLHIWLKKDLT